MIDEYIYLITATGFVFAYFCFIVLGEYVRSKFDNDRLFSFRHSLTNIAVLLSGVFVFTLLNQYILHSQNIFDTVAKHKLFDIPIDWVTFFLFLVIIDFLSFVSHVIYHKVRILWAFHAVHHSDKLLDVSTTIRVSWSASVFGISSYSLLTYIGVDKTLQVAIVQTIFLHQLLVHSTLLRGVLPGWVSYIFITPDMHATHHLRKYGQYNFGFIFPFWDRLFGTLHPETAVHSSDYGVSGITNNTNPITIHCEPLIVMLSNKKST